MSADAAVPTPVFVPASPVLRDGIPGVILETRRLPDGTLALPAFTTLDKLTVALGDCQPWVALPLRTVQQILWQAGAGTIALNPTFDTGAWRWDECEVATLTGLRLPGKHPRSLPSRLEWRTLPR